MHNRFVYKINNIKNEKFMNNALKMHSCTDNISVADAYITDA